MERTTKKKDQTKHSKRRLIISAAYLIQLSFDGENFRHTPVVVSVGWPVTPENVLVAAHSYDADNRPLSTYSYQDIRFLKIFGVWHP